MGVKDNMPIRIGNKELWHWIEWPRLQKEIDEPKTYKTVDWKITLGYFCVVFVVVLLFIAIL